MGLLNIGLKSGLKNGVPKHVAEDLCAIEMGLALLLVARQVDSVQGMALPNNTILADGRSKQRNQTRLSTVGNLVRVHESRVAR